MRSPRGMPHFGITGRTGQVLARASVDGRWTVSGFARPDSTVPAGPGPFIVVRDDFTDADRVAETVAGTEAVCCVLGPRPPHTEAFCAPATRTIIQTMKQVGVRRLVRQAGAMVGAGNRTLAFECLARTVVRRQPAASRDRVEQEGTRVWTGWDSREAAAAGR